MEIEDPHIAMCFGGGMGLTGEVCGAVSGAVMAISLVKGPAGNEQEFLDIMSLARDLRSRFETEMGTINCRDLTGVDLAAPGGFESYIESGKSEEVCVPAVDAAYRAVMDVLKKVK